MTVVELLNKAKAMLTPETWGQGCGLARPPEGTKCMEMALDAAGPGMQVWPAIKLLMAATGGKRIADWQDAPERTLEEVHAAFDRAIALAEAHR